MKKQKQSSHHKRIKKKPVDIEDDTWNDSFFGGGKAHDDEVKGGNKMKKLANSREKTSKIRAFDGKDNKRSRERDDESKGQMDLDDLLDDGLTTEGKMTINEGSEITQFNNRKHSEQQRMITTVNDGQSMRFCRRQRVSKNYREMQSSIELSNKRSVHRTD